MATNTNSKKPVTVTKKPVVKTAPVRPKTEQDYKNDYMNAFKRGDKAGMDKANQGANALRDSQGLSGTYDRTTGRRYSDAEMVANKYGMNAGDEFNKDKYANDLYESKAAGLKTINNAKLAAIQARLEQDMNNAEGEKDLANRNYEGEVENTNQSAYDNVERGKVMGAMRGITSSNQMAGLEQGYLVNRDKMNRKSGADRDFKLQDIARRISTIQSGASSDTNLANAEYKAGLQGARADANLRAEDRWVQERGRKDQINQWLAGNELTDKRAQTEMKFRTSEREAGQKFQDYMTEKGYKHDKEMSELQFEHQKAILNAKSWQDAKAEIRALEYKQKEKVQLFMDSAIKNNPNFKNNPYVVDMLGKVTTNQNAYNLLVDYYVEAQGLSAEQAKKIIEKGKPSPEAGNFLIMSLMKNFGKSGMSGGQTNTGVNGGWLGMAKW